MGAVVGSAMGAIIGVWTVMKTRKLIVLPISILTSGAFFGFIMMVGSIVRTDTENIYITSQPETAIPFWRIKYAAANPITGMNTSCWRLFLTSFLPSFDYLQCTYIFIHIKMNCNVSVVTFHIFTKKWWLEIVREKERTDWYRHVQSVYDLCVNACMRASRRWMQDNLISGSFFMVIVELHAWLLFWLQFSIQNVLIIQ